jgi:hypothetical protein
VAWARAAGFSDIAATASAWCFSEADDRAWWGGLWADRMTDSAMGLQAVDLGFVSRQDIQEIAAAWRRWAAHPDGWFAVLHGEILCRVAA